MAKKVIEIYDTTLRDGSQGEGVSFSIGDKISITRELDSFGVDYIEGGWPGSNPKDMEYFKEVKKLKFKNAQIAAFGSTRHSKNTPATDPNLKKLVAAKTDVVTIFGKSWDLHVRDALRVSLDTNLAMIESSVKYLVKRCGKVIFDAEHFFDGFLANPEYALKCLEAAANGGAETLALCDTNGGCLPYQISSILEQVTSSLGGVGIAIHAHNDGGLATANSIEAVLNGAMQVQGTMNGLGERCGNANLIEIIANLNLKTEFKAAKVQNLKKITEFSRYIYEVANMLPNKNMPYVGRSAFAHKAGIHASAIARNKKTYEHVSPESVGNERRILISELSGRSNLKSLGITTINNDPKLMKLLLGKIMELENKGYTYEAARASFSLMVDKVCSKHKTQFIIDSYRVMSEVDASGRSISEATIKSTVGKTHYHTVSEGEDGPVDALFKALQKALKEDFPQVEKLQLTDYKVHIVNPMAATGAKVRVVVQSEYNGIFWGTVGVSENIIDASFHALLDSLEYLLKQRAPRVSKKKASAKKRK